MTKEYRIFITKTFEEDFEKLPSIEQQRIERVKEQLKVNPFVGKPLGYGFFREKKDWREQIVLSDL